MTNGAVSAGLGCLAALLVALSAHAHEGHDDKAEAPTAGGVALRIEAATDLFEVVGVVENGTMTLYLDRYATNEPVVGATIGIEAGSAQGEARANPDGTYTFKHAALAQAGALPVTFSVAAGADADLLTAELVIPDPARAGEPAAQVELAWKRASWMAAAVILIGTVAGLSWLRRRHFSRKSVR